MDAVSTYEWRYDTLLVSVGQFIHVDTNVIVLTIIREKI